LRDDIREKDEGIGSQHEDAASDRRPKEPDFGKSA
jgi:hypothetical protein